jgi:hypothetical protein
LGAALVVVVLPATVVVVVVDVDVVEVDVNDPNALTVCGVLYIKPFGAPDVPSPN